MTTWLAPMTFYFVDMPTQTGISKQRLIVTVTCSGVFTVIFPPSVMQFL